jgi:hypothetical protein
MKMLCLILLCLPTALSAQFKVAVQGNSNGISPVIEYRQEFKEPLRNDTITFGPRAGYVWQVFGQSDHFYFQQVVQYKGFIISPVWLRSYNKKVGYQVPTSLGYRCKNFEVWLNYVYHARSLDVHLNYFIR